MADFIFLMHNDAGPREGANGWPDYLEALRATGRFRGGSSIGAGACFKKGGPAREVTPHLAGLIRVSAVSLSDAAALLSGNPVYEAGGTVEIRELPAD